MGFFVAQGDSSGVFADDDSNCRRCVLLLCGKLLVRDIGTMTGIVILSTGSNAALLPVLRLVLGLTVGAVDSDSFSSCCCIRNGDACVRLIFLQDAVGANHFGHGSCCEICVSSLRTDLPQLL